MKILSGIFLLVMAAAGPAPSRAAENLQPIFDGQTLEGWDERGEAIWKVENGIITGVTGKGGHGWLCTKKIHGDFILELEVKIASGNSGIQIRSHFDEAQKNKMIGLQIEVDPSARAWSAGLYEQGRRGWLQALTNGEPAHLAFKSNDWNKYRIECRGDHIQSWLNGAAATDYIDSMDLDGFIALQVHAGANSRVQFRNVRLEDLGKSAWKKIWDGQTLSGWHAIGKGDWKIADGVLAGRHDRDEKDFGHLVTDKIFRDFTVRLQYRTVKGNSGLYFRVDEKGFSGVSGFQAEIDPEKDAGGLYETNGRNWVFQPAPAQVKKWFKPGQWNTMTVSARGRRIKVDLNGYQTVDLRDDPGRSEGRLALQLHGGQDGEIYFKNIEVLDGP
jgi:hypothetical protein